VQVSGARVASSTAFSSSCRWLLVPRTSNTPVAAWSWPTWVVESEKCFGSCVHLVGVLVSFEKNFYRLSFTPLSGSPNRSFTHKHANQQMRTTKNNTPNKKGLKKRLRKGFGSKNTNARNAQVYREIWITSQKAMCLVYFN
jgi:hypothetical protein